MIKDWAYLTRLTGDKQLIVNEVTVVGEDITIKGQFELPHLARLSTDDQIFMAMFVVCHGSIKQMEKHFNISYPTVKSRLNQIAESLDFIKIDSGSPDDDSLSSKVNILDRLSRGEISVEDAVSFLKKDGHDEQS